MKREPLWCAPEGAIRRVQPNKLMVPTAPIAPATTPPRLLRRHIDQSLGSYGAAVEEWR